MQELGGQRGEQAYFQENMVLHIHNYDYTVPVPVYVKKKKK